MMFFVFCFFFFKQKTAYEMRISDWSSDVCSSDLAAAGGVEDGTVGLEAALVDGGDHRVAVFQIGIFAEQELGHRQPQAIHGGTGRFFDRRNSGLNILL